MANNSLRPPWIKTAASRNIAKRARIAAIAKRNACWRCFGLGKVPNYETGRPDPCPACQQPQHRAGD